MLAQDIEEAYSDAQRKKEEVNTVNDIDEEAVSDEPTIPVEHTEEKKIVVFSQAIKMFAQDYVILTEYKRIDDAEVTHIYLGKAENYDNETNGYNAVFAVWQTVCADATRTY